MDALLVSDVGGTNVRFAVARRTAAGYALSPIWARRGADFPDFMAAAAAFLEETGERVEGASFGLAGPVIGGRVELLHRGWTVDAAACAARFGWREVRLFNDFFAMARAAPELAGDALVEIAPGESRPGASLAVGGPGTGFGVAILKRLRDGWTAIGGEGGHRAFVAVDGFDWEVRRLLAGRHGYVSVEMVTAGSGFADALAATQAALGAPARPMSQAEVFAAAEAGEAAAVAFCRLRAAATLQALGDLALTAGAHGGVYVAGGVGMRLARWLSEPEALARFRERGARTEYLARVPIRLIVGDGAPLIGAAHLFVDAGLGLA